jgi:hypothetical protein
LAKARSWGDDGRDAVRQGEAARTSVGCNLVEEKKKRKGETEK